MLSTDLVPSRTACFWQGVRDGLPIAIGYFAVAFTFGIASKPFGLDALQAAFMSFTNMTSAGQFAALGIIGSGGSLVEMALTQLIINLRYCLMSCAVSQHLPDGLPYYHRFLMAYVVTDEIFGVSIRQKLIWPCYIYGMLAVTVPGWTCGTALGVLTGKVLPLRLISALSVALYSMFIAVIVPAAKDSKVLACLIPLAMLVSSAFNLLPVLRDISYGSRIIILTVSLSLAAAYFFPVHEEEEEQ